MQEDLAFDIIKKFYPEFILEIILEHDSTEKLKIIRDLERDEYLLLRKQFSPSNRVNLDSPKIGAHLSRVDEDSA